MSKRSDERIKELEEEVRILSKAVSILIQNSTILYSTVENHSKAIKTFMETYNNAMPKIEESLVIFGKFAKVSSLMTHYLSQRIDSDDDRDKYIDQG